MTASESGLIKKREITSGTKEWADHNVNCIKGCSNNCRYCYARMMAKRFGRCTDDAWKEMEINRKIVDKTFGRYEGRVMFPSTHDIVDAPEAKEACLVVIGKLLEAGNDLLITTKPRLSVTKEITSRFNSFKLKMQFRFTITSLDNHLLSFWEPNAPCFEERLESLRHAYEGGFKTSVSVEPFLDHDPKSLIDMLSPYVTESIWLGPMNYIPTNGIADEDRQYYTEIRKRYAVNRLREIFEDLRDYPRIRFKDSMTNRLATLQTEATEMSPLKPFTQRGELVSV